MTNNVSLGPLALGSVTTATGVTAVGAQAGRDVDSGNNNALYGYAAGRALTSGARNVAIGAGAMLSSTEAVDTVAIGEFAMANAVANGARNVAVGNVALGAYTGSDAAAVGHYALPVTTGANNVALGSFAGRLTTTGANNIFIGYNSGGSGTGQPVAASDTIVIGANAGASQSGQIVLGTATQKEMQLFGDPWARQFANFDTVIGQRAGNTSTNGGGRVIIGYQAGVSMDTTDDESTVVIGYVAGNLAKQFRYSVAIGDRAAQFAFNCIDCAIVGSQAGRNLGRLAPYEYDSDDEDHILAAGPDVTHGGSLPVPGLVGATFMGKNAGRYNTIGLNNTGFGDSALGFTTVGEANTAVGYVCGEGNVIGSRNTWVGQGIRLRLYSGDDNAQIGYGIGTNLGSHGDWRAGGSRNSNVGTLSGYVWGGNDTASIGFRAFFNMTGGDGGDVAVGARAGEAIVTGGQNIFIGQDAGQGEAQAVDIRNSIAIGAETVTTKDNQVILGNAAAEEVVICGVTFTKAQLEALLVLVS